MKERSDGKAESTDGVQWKINSVKKKSKQDTSENHTACKTRVWDYWMGEIMKTERILEGNLSNLFTVLMSLCDSDTKNQDESMKEFSEFEKKLDAIWTSRPNQKTGLHCVNEWPKQKT